MEKLVITGPTPLRGDVTISGAKNAAVAIIPATILINGVCTIENLPNISDVKSYCEILKTLGIKITWINRHTIQVDSRNITSSSAPLDLTRKFRASYYLIGALLGRCGHAEVGLPGGCNLGPRPIDQHIKGFEALGAKVNVSSIVKKVLNDDVTKSVPYTVIGKTYFVGFSETVGVQIENKIKELINDNVNNENIILNFTNNVEESLLGNFVYVSDDKKIVMSGKTMSVLNEEKIMKRLGINLPFIVLLNKYLIDYNLIDNYILDYTSLGGALWK